MLTIFCRCLSLGAAVALAGALAGCAGHQGLKAGTVLPVTASNPVVEKVQVAAPVAELAPPIALDYQVGIGDILAVTVYGRPELSTGSKEGGAQKGSRVDGNGDIHLSLVGKVPVVGLSLGQIRDKLEQSYRKYLQEPSVVVEVAEYKSKPLYLMGQFRNPGVYYMDRPLTLLQGIALGSGFDATANLRGVRLMRDKKIVPVDIYALVQEGKVEQNAWLQPGDTIYVPDNKNQNIFVFGAVRKPGAQPMQQGQMNLLQAVSAAELRDTGLDINNVRIIRSLTQTTGELMVVDLEKIMKGEALSLQLMEGDIVFIPKTGIGNWNDAISEMLPSLQAVGTILQPFVNIKYLSQ